MRHQTYADIFIGWLKNRLKRGINTFTHRDIALVTDTNCSYSVLQRIRLKFDLKESMATKLAKSFDKQGQEMKIKKSYKVYEVVGERC
jgi:hypothetical protein